METEAQRCFKCGIEKPLEEFYKHPAMANGRLGKCKVCTKADVSKNYRDKIDQYSQYYRDREGTAHRKRWRRDEQRKLRAANPVQYHCRIITNDAIKSGALVKKPCEKCGAKKAEAHHEDYHKPLEVNWLCFKDHRALHREKDAACQNVQ